MAAVSQGVVSSGLGIVKQVLSGDCIVIRGQAKGGPPPERVIALSNIVAPRLARKPQGQEKSKDEPFAWQSREYLRKLLVGKEVKFAIEYKVPASGREYGTVWLKIDGEPVNVNNKVVMEGWAEVRSGGKSSEEYTQLQESETVAKANKRGKWNSDLDINPIRDITWSLDNVQEFVDKNLGKEIEAVVEHIRDGSTIRVFFIQSFIQATVMFTGIKSPAMKREGTVEVLEPFADQAKFFIESRLLQRDVKISIEGVTAQNVIGSIIHPAGNIALLLVKEGLAKCVDWSMRLLLKDKDKFRQAEKEAKDGHIRIWKDYQPSASAVTSHQKEFSGKVMEVVTVESLVLKLANGKYQKVSFSSFRPPRLDKEDSEGQVPQSSKIRPLYDVPYLFEGREFLRKRLIGKRVDVTLDYVKPANEGFPERICCTVMKDGINLAEALISKGFGKALRHRQDDDQRSPFYDDLLSAELRAEKNKKGLFSKKEYIPMKIAEFTGEPAKSKHFLPFLKRAGRTTALVEFVASGSRVKLYLPKDTCLINLILAGVTCPRASQTVKGQCTPGEVFGDEALVFTKELVLQKEVEVEVDSVDRGGNFVGWLYVDGKNLSQLLLEEGFGRIHSSAERFNDSCKLFEAEQGAKDRRKHIWEDYKETINEEVLEEGKGNSVTKEEANNEKQISYEKVLIVGVLDPVTIWSQLVDRADELQEMMAELQMEMSMNPPTAGTFNPRRSAKCAAKYTDGKWYRAVIERLTGSEVTVHYIDYGNDETVLINHIATLPQRFQDLAPFAKLSKLALVSFANDDDWNREALGEMQKLTENICQISTVLYKDQDHDFVILLDSEGTDIGKKLVQDGLLQVITCRDKSIQHFVSTYIKAQDIARKGRIGIWCYGDFRED